MPGKKTGFKIGSIELQMENVSADRRERRSVVGVRVTSHQMYLNNPLQHFG